MWKSKTTRLLEALKEFSETLEDISDRMEKIEERFEEIEEKQERYQQQLLDLAANEKELSALKSQLLDSSKWVQETLWKLMEQNFKVLTTPKEEKKMSAVEEYRQRKELERQEEERRNRHNGKSKGKLPLPG